LAQFTDSQDSTWPVSWLAISQRTVRPFVHPSLSLRLGSEGGGVYEPKGQFFWYGSTVSSLGAVPV
jgi:hypothetical protein